MSSETILTFRSGKLMLELSPAIGGAISAFRWYAGATSSPILRDCHGALEKVLDAASFPLVPYVNRIRDGRFVFRGREVRLEPNLAGDPSPLHGQGWLNPWHVQEATETRATLSFRHEVGEWPWVYEARQQFSLDESSLLLTLICQNLSGEPMPCGLGHHPYFPCGPHTRIHTDVTAAWTIDEKVLPVDKVLAEGRYALRDRLVCSQDLDNGFGGWSGEAQMSDPAWPFDVRLSSPDARFFQIYSPSSGGIFVAEPVSHANAALNASEADWPELGMRILDPGEEMSLTMQLDVIPK
ncbi:MAG: aldose 1-epimerase [Sphingomonas sp.]|nr:aldose 1-epimerase [Sphingomonas sp.]